MQTKYPLGNPQHTLGTRTQSGGTRLDNRQGAIHQIYTPTATLILVTLYSDRVMYPYTIRKAHDCILLSHFVLTTIVDTIMGSAFWFQSPLYTIHSLMFFQVVTRTR